MAYTKYCLLIVVLFAVVGNICAKKADLKKKASEDLQRKILASQVELSGGSFTFGTLDTDVEGWREYAEKGKEENQRIEDMKDSVGAETFDMINEQLAGYVATGLCGSLEAQSMTFSKRGNDHSSPFPWISTVLYEISLVT